MPTPLDRSRTLRHYDLAKSIFLAALDLAPEQRAGFVTSQSGGDLELQREVESLLAFHDETQEFALMGATPPPPTLVGDFQIVRELGHGGMGVVLLAQRGEAAPVALKLLRPDLISPELIARFQREATALARLDHPGIARLIETGVASTPQGARPWLAMEYIEGVSLREWARAQHPLAEKLELLARIAEAVHHAHVQGVVHRDLKPENMLVRPNGTPVILDFGVARLTDSDLRATSVMTSLGVLVGTIRYMSPEQAEAQLGAIGPRSDVYTLGVVACELLEGRLPYEVPEESVHRALVAVMTSRMRPLVEVESGFRAPLERVLRAALAKRPEQRL
ncbi:MAG: serine/threonine-protein kinase, partial [Candidatus Eisenbacteria bacterium]